METEIATAVLLPPLQRLILPKVEERFSYVFSNKKHIERLEEEVKNLVIKKDEIDERVEDAKRQGGTVKQHVDDWQKKAHEIIIESQKFLEKMKNFDATCFFKLCYNVVQLYKSGKEAAMLHKKVNEKYQKAMTFSVVATHPPAAPIVVSSAGTSGQEFRSREKILDEVISALQDDSNDVVGIHGMGGVGKTTLVDKLIHQAREQNLFSVVVEAVVSKTIDIRGIQNQIADRIQFKFQAESTQGRRDELCQILSQKTENDGKILVILDDMWEAIDITTKIGIPRIKRCKVVITTRMTYILRGGTINACRLFEVGVLEDEEAKVLFAKSLGGYYFTIVHDSQYTTIMRGLLERCGGLPLALVTLAGALKGKDHHIWEDAIKKLRNNSGKDIEGMSRNVWSTIMFSFNSLENEEVEKVLLLCSLFPEDADVPVQKLVSYGFGIDLFKDLCRLDDAMRRVHGFIDKLVSCSLLLSTKLKRSDSYCVRVHDVIRDVSMDIASQDEYNFFTGTFVSKRKDFHAISLSIMDFEKLGKQLLDVSKLRVLRLQCEGEVSIPIDFFKGMEKLKVLDLVVDNVVSFSILDPLTSLEHLFLEVLAMRELPSNFVGSKYLKVLDLSRCKRLEKIPTNSIAGLMRLEGLLLATKQVINLVELQSLSRLQILHAQLKVTTEQHIPQEVASKLKSLSSFKLLITGCEKSFCVNYYESEGLLDELFPKSLTFFKCQSDILVFIIDLLPKGLHSLGCFQVEGLIDLKMVDFSLLRELVVCDFNELSCLFGADTRLSKLEYMRLCNLPLLEGICEPKELPMIMLNVGTSTTTSCGSKTPLFPSQELVPAVKEVCTYGIAGSPAPPPASFSQLRVLKIIKLPRVTSVFPSLSLYKQAITSLRHLHIEDCESLEEVVALAEDVAYPIILSLEKLRLKNLPSLLHFYGGEHTLKFPLLHHIDIEGCDPFMSLVDMSTKGFVYSRLQVVELQYCEEMKYVFAAGVEFPTLWILSLCSMLELEDICGHGGGALWKNSFPALHDLTLNSLPKIMNNNITDSLEDARKYLFGPEDVLPSIEVMHLSDMGCAEIWHFPSATDGSFSQLRRLDIKRLPHVKYVFPSLAFCTQLTRLKWLEISGCENLEEVVSGGDEQVEDRDADNQRYIISAIPALEEITLSELPKLKHFYGGRHTLNFPLCVTLEIEDCEIMKSFAPMLSDAPNLTLINDNQSTPEITVPSKIMATCQDSHEDARKHLFGHEDVLPAIETMTLYNMGCAELWRFPPGTGGSFSQLRIFYMTGLPYIKYVFPSIAFCTHLLTRLEELSICGCDNLEEVVYYEGGDDEQVEDNQLTIINSVFPALKEISLTCLPKLKHFYGGRHTLKFPLLDTLDIEGCESMECFATIPPDAPKLGDEDSFRNHQPGSSEDDSWPSEDDSS